MAIQKHFILIDDDHATNVYHEIILSDADLPASFTFFNSAEKALGYLKTLDTPPDYILLDINMPRMNGWEFLDALPPYIAKKNTPYIIMLTTSLSSFDSEKSKNHPLVRQIKEKPLSVEIVKQLLNEYAS